MLIGLCGGLCAGKKTIADYLVKHHAFTHIYLARPSTASMNEKLAGESTISRTDQAETDNGETTYHFPDVETLIDFITKKWDQCWVTTDIWDEEIFETLSRRPFFLLVSVDAPLGLRWRRLKARCELNNQTPLNLKDFVLRNDDHLYGPKAGLATLIDRAEVRLINSSTSFSGLYRALSKLDLSNEERLRPSWDLYFMQLASLAAQRSNCMKRRVGCVLVRERRVISTGYNGTPRKMRNCNEGGCPRCNGGQGAGMGLSTCLCIHAEENALLEAGRERIREGSVLYCDTCPCLTCSIKISQVGISEVVYSQSYSMDQDTAAIFLEAGVKLRQFSPPRKGLVYAGMSWPAGI